jgi:hypothetical protein
MKTIRRNALPPLLLGLALALPAAPLWAVPAYTAPPPDKARPDSEAQARQHCMLTVRAQLRTRDGEQMDIGKVRLPDQAPDWQDGDAASWSQHAYAALHGSGKSGFDTLLGECRLADSDREKEERINDGVDLTELLNKIDEWLDLNRHPGEEDQPAPEDPHQLHLVVGADQQLHALLGQIEAGAGLGAVSHGPSLLPPEYRDQDDQGRHGQSGGQPGGLAHQGRMAPPGPSQPERDGLTSAVPEPSVYAMLLGGLAVIALRRRA